MYLAPIINGPFISPDGRPISGGSIETYLSGSMTPRIAYKDANGAQPHDWPIALNSIGEPIAPVFLDEGPYRIVRKDASGLQIGSAIDGVHGIVGEGTVVFDPYIFGYSVSGTQGYGERKGRATIRGSRAWYEIYMLLNAKDVATAGALRIGGFPFKSINMASVFNGAFVSAWKFNIGAAYSQVGAYFLPNSSDVQLLKNGNNIANANLVAADLLPDSEIILSGWVELATP